MREIETIESDDENLQGTSSEEDEDDEDEKQIEEPQRKKKANSKKEANPKTTTTSFFEDITQQSTFSGKEPDSNSWDFTNAIGLLKSSEGKSKQTSLDDKIRRVVERRKVEENNEDQDENNDSNDDEEEEKDESTTRPLSSSIKPEIIKSEEMKRKKQEQRAKSFVELQLSRPLLRSTQALKYSSPTPIQAEAIPLILKGKDILASAVTGSGKTAAYLLPVIERLLLRERKSGPITRVLIIVPTRELAQQISSMLEKLCQFCPDISQAVVVGGLSSITQTSMIRARPDILIATPGRLIDHLRNTMSFDILDLEILILDEADRLLELGFADELREIIKYAPVKRQTLLFSATISSDVTKLAELSLDNPVKIATDPLFDVAQRLVQEFVRVRKPTNLSLDSKEAESEMILRRESLLYSLCTQTVKNRVMIFFQQKRQAHRTCIAFGLLGLRCAELHGNLTQAKRLEALQRFRDGDVDFLFCTDLAARGIDVSGVSCVINFELPKDITTYVHRVGRTARAGKGGLAISLVGEERRSTMKELLKSSSSSQFQSRTISSVSASKSYEKLNEIQKEIDSILSQEHVEREIRLAEVGMTKAENVMEHEEEILSRPKKTWFQSKSEKQDLKDKAKELFNAGDEGINRKEEEAEEAEEEEKKDDRVRLLPRAKRRRIAAKEKEEKDLKRAARELRNAEESGDQISKEKKKEMLIPSELKQRAIAKNAKQGSRKRAVDDDGDLVVDLEKEANRKAKFSASSNAKKDNFVAKRSRDSSLPEFKTKSANRVLKKGAKKGTHKFKSKSKYKRR